MMKLPFLFGLSFVTLVSASLAAEKKTLTFESDPIEYIKEYVVSFMEDFLSKDNHEFSDAVKVSKNAYSPAETAGRSNGDYEDRIETYIKGHDVQMKLPVIGSVTMNARNLDNDELDFNVNFGYGSQEARKSKLKKIFIPILVFVLLKAMTLVPLALGVLILKAWNALQLSFFSFVVAVGLAIFQLCRKLATDHAVPQISAHETWPAQQYYARSLDTDAQDMAYSAYLP